MTVFKWLLLISKKIKVLNLKLAAYIVAATATTNIVTVIQSYSFLMAYSSFEKLLSAIIMYLILFSVKQTTSFIF